MTLALLAIVLVLVFHSGPDRYTLLEHFIQITVKAEIDTLSSSELGILSHGNAQFRSWTILEAVFALGLLVGVLMPMDLAAIYILPFILSIFLVLGEAYLIQKGIFAGPGNM